MGKEEIITSGQEGSKSTTYRIPIYQDGTEGSREIVSTEIVKEARPDTVHVGTKEVLPEEE